jgi:hypothetical protein
VASGSSDGSLGNSNDFVVVALWGAEMALGNSGGSFRSSGGSL